MEHYRHEDIEASVEDLNIQCDKGCNKRPIKPPCVHDKVMCAGNNSSLLFFFLILVIIVCQSDCDIEMDTLMWFFLLLVALYRK